jgi:hypothetical protein
MKLIAERGGRLIKPSCENCRFLRRSLGNEGVRVTADPEESDDGAVHLGERKIASIVVDDEDGDRSFAFSMKLPVGREVLQSYLRKLFENDRLSIVARGRKTDSVELNADGEFLGVISATIRSRRATLQVAILDFDSKKSDALHEVAGCSIVDRSGLA